jgi:hypothetical protein
MSRHAPFPGVQRQRARGSLGSRQRKTSRGSRIPPAELDSAPTRTRWNESATGTAEVVSTSKRRQGRKRPPAAAAKKERAVSSALAPQPKAQTRRSRRRNAADASHRQKLTASAHSAVQMIGTQKEASAIRSWGVPRPRAIGEQLRRPSQARLHHQARQQLRPGDPHTGELGLDAKRQQRRLAAPVGQSGCVSAGANSSQWSRWRDGSLEYSGPCGGTKRPTTLRPSAAGAQQDWSDTPKTSRLGRWQWNSPRREPSDACVHTSVNFNRSRSSASNLEIYRAHQVRTMRSV